MSEENELTVVQVLARRLSRFNSVAWSPDGKRVAAGGSDGLIWMWDALTGKFMRVLEGHSSSMSSVAWSPNGAQPASGSDDMTVRIWDAASGKSVRVLEGHRSGVLSVAWSPSGAQLASGSDDKTVRIWNAASGKSERGLEGHNAAVNSVAWSPSGAQLASGSSDQTVRIWDAACAWGNSERVRERHSNSVNSVAWSPSGAQLASGSYDRTVLWDAASGKSAHVLEGSVNSVAWSPSGAQLASGSNDITVRIWDAASGKSARVLEGHSGFVNSVAWSPSGAQLASGSADQTVRIWNAVSGKSARVLEGHDRLVMSVAWSPSGTQLASGSYDNAVRIWDAASGKSERVLEGHSSRVVSVAWSPSGAQLASGSQDHKVRIWDAASGKSECVLGGHSDWVNSVAWSPSGAQLASGSGDKTVRIWDAAPEKSERVLQGHSAYVNSVAWSPNGAQLASGSLDYTVRIWDAASGKSERVLQGHSGFVLSVAWSPSGAQLASGSYDQTVRIWDAASGRSVRVLQGHTEPVRNVAWSPSGALLLSIDESGELVVWNTATGEPLNRYPSPAYAWSGIGCLFVQAAQMSDLKLDSGALLRFFPLIGAASIASTQFRSAKVVLLGESGVGKSTLANYLATGQYQDQPSTHGMKIWPLAPESLVPEDRAPAGEQRELLVWDLGGQEDYQLIHQIFLHDTRIALFLMDATRGHDQFDDIARWDKCLTAQLGRRGETARKLLLHSKFDRATGAPVDFQRVKAMLGAGFEDFKRISTKPGFEANMDDFKQTLSRIIDWSNAPIFTNFKTRADAYAAVTQAREAGKLFLSVRELEERLSSHADFNKKDFDSAIRQVSEQGRVVEMDDPHHGRRLILRIEDIEKYAGSLIQVAKNNLRGIPAIGLDQIFSPKTKWHEEKLSPADRKDMLDAVVELLQAHELCFRSQGLLIFPTAAQLERVPSLSDLTNPVAVHLEVSGALKNVYAAIVVHLRRMRGFGEDVRLWKGWARFEQSDEGACAIHLEEGTAGSGHLELRFNDRCSEWRQTHFVNAVLDLARTEGANPVLAREMEHCGAKIPADTVSKALALGQKSVSCSICKEDIRIFDPARVEEFNRREEVAILREANVVRSSRPPLQREGYALFVRLCDVSPATPADQYADWIEALDREFWREIQKNEANFFPNPIGGAIYLDDVADALLAGTRIVRLLTTLGVTVGAGVAWGTFDRITGVETWNAAAVPLNEAARLASCEAAPGYVLVRPKVRDDAVGAAVHYQNRFGPSASCKVKGKDYAYHVYESVEAMQGWSKVEPSHAKIRPASIVLCDIIGYSKQDPRTQTELAAKVADCVSASLNAVGAAENLYNPAGDGGYVVFDSAGGFTLDRTILFAEDLRQRALSYEVPIRLGISNGPVARTTRRNAVGGAILRAEQIAGHAPEGGFGVLEEFWKPLSGDSSRWHAAPVAGAAGVLAVSAAVTARRVAAVQSTAKAIHILHLSDLHVTAADTPEKLLVPLQLDTMKRPDYLVVSGDLADRSQPEGFERAFEVLTYLLKNLGLNGERLILCPGNHDADDSIVAYEFLPDKVIKARGLTPGLEVSPGVFRVRNDVEYPKRFGRFASLYHRLTQHDFSLDPERQGRDLLFENHRIQFLTLNSAWEIDEYHRKRASLHEQARAVALESAANRLKDAKAQEKLNSGDKLFRIAVWHHALRDMPAVEPFGDLLNEAGFALILHGDLHERAAIHSPFRRPLTATGAGALRSSEQPCLYNWIEIAQDFSYFRIYVRQQKKPGGPFEQSFDFRDEDGRPREYFEVVKPRTYTVP